MKRNILFISLWITATMLATAQFKLPSLPYHYGALEPYIDSTTMYIHLNNHHAAYVTNLNKALEKYPDLQKKSLEELLTGLDKLPAEIQTAVRNNGGGHYNHSLFWTVMAPAGTTTISPALEKLLIANFGSVDAFKADFEKAALGRFGSGWVWLVKEKDGKLKIVSTANQDNTLMPGSAVSGKPILALDVWEHAYYLKYQSKRAAYAKAFWSVVNWKEVEKRINEK
ncbi:MAG: Manganese/iron superoxide dismutase [Bacteroidetes bacterium]|nr:Manganese/iron superoxide dismutase [Bacteroidota bacterium]